MGTESNNRTKRIPFGGDDRLGDDMAIGDPIEDMLRSAADFFVFAPLGLATSLRTVVPEWVERGRRQVRAANTIGKFVVPIARRKIKRSLNDVVDQLRVQRNTGGPDPACRSDKSADRSGDEVEGESDSTQDVKGKKAPSQKAQKAQAQKAQGKKAQAKKAESKRADPNNEKGKNAKGKANRPTTKAAAKPTAKPTAELAEVSLEASATMAEVAGDGFDAPRLGTDQPEAGSALGILGYDNLPASTILELLDGLTPTQLLAIETYEAANRARRTILYGIANRTNTPGANSGVVS
jgi:hypothetical protein